MVISEYEMMFENFASAEINNLSLKEYQSVISDYFHEERLIFSDIEFLKINKLPAEIYNPKLEELGFLIHEI